MRIQASPIGKLALFSAIFLIAALCSWTQGTGVRPLITQPIDESNLTILRGNTHPLARAQLDRGLAPDNRPMDRMLLVLKRSPQQEAALQRWMAQQLDQSSPNYHKWLTPAQFGQMFGPSDQDIQTITRWLESHGFTGINVATGRTTIEFSGDAAQVQAAFHTAIHKFVVSGAPHWANVQDPAIPAAITPAVAGVAALHNFFPNKMSHVASAAARSRTAARKPRSIRPQFTFTDSQGNQWFALGPTDFATIYNVLPLWNLSIDGSGETIAVLS